MHMHRDNSFSDLKPVCKYALLVLHRTSVLYTRWNSHLLFALHKANQLPVLTRLPVLQIRCQNHFTERTPM